MNRNTTNTIPFSFGLNILFILALGRVNFPEYGNSECVSLGEIQITSSRDRSGGDYDRSRGSHHRRSRSRSDSRDRNREGRGGGDGRGLESVLDMDSKVLYNKVSSSVSPFVFLLYVCSHPLVVRCCGMISS